MSNLSMVAVFCTLVPAKAPVSSPCPVVLSQNTYLVCWCGWITLSVLAPGFSFRNRKPPLSRGFWNPMVISGGMTVHSSTHSTAPNLMASVACPSFQTVAPDSTTNCPNRAEDSISPFMLTLTKGLRSFWQPYLTMDDLPEPVGPEIDPLSPSSSPDTNCSTASFCGS